MKGCCNSRAINVYNEIPGYTRLAKYVCGRRLPIGWGWRKQATFICHCEEPQATWQSRPGPRLSKSDYRAAEVDSGCLPSTREHQVTIWLIEYNFNRPHQSLGYLAPIEYIERELAKICPPVLPMWSASTVF